MSQKISSPFISIIIPCLNESSCIGILLDNLSHQTYTNTEVVVVDGQSEDNTADIVQSFQNKLSLKLLTSHKRHVSVQRNLGAAQARGEWLLFLDADTQISPTFLEEFIQTPKLKNYDCLAFLIHTESKDLANKAVAIVSNLGLIAGKHLKQPQAWGCAMAIKRIPFHQVGGFSTQINHQEDSELVARLIKNQYKFTVLENPKFVMSFRRFHTHGHLKVIQAAALSILLNHLKGYDNHLSKKLYPMEGGNSYISNSGKHSSHHFIKDLSTAQLKVFSDFRHKLHTKSLKILSNNENKVTQLTAKLNQVISNRKT